MQFWQKAPGVNGLMTGLIKGVILIEGYALPLLMIIDL